MLETTKTIDTSELYEAIAKLEAVGRPDMDEREELMALKTLWEQVEQVGHGYGAVRDGLLLVRDDHWKEWAMERIHEQSGDALESLPNHVMINWDTTVWQFRQDYYPVSFKGMTYWVR